MTQTSDLPSGYTAKLAWPDLNDAESASASLTLTLRQAGTVSFWRKVSSEDGFDFLRFYVDDVLQSEWSGEVAWARVIYNVSTGVHTFRWTFAKDASLSAGADTAWITGVEVTGVGGNPVTEFLEYAGTKFTLTRATKLALRVTKATATANTILVDKARYKADVTSLIAGDVSVVAYLDNMPPTPTPGGDVQLVLHY